MANLTIKKIPDALLDRLRESARDHRRSLNSEVIHHLERSVATRRIDADALLARLRDVQESVPLPPLTDERLTEALGRDRS